MLSVGPRVRELVRVVPVTDIIILCLIVLVEWMMKLKIGVWVILLILGRWLQSSLMQRVH